VQAVGSEKCRFPLSACEWHIKPGSSEIQLITFEHSADASVSEPEVSADSPLVAPASGSNSLPE
jgi:hypothetical protein